MRYKLYVCVYENSIYLSFIWLHIWHDPQILGKNLGFRESYKMQAYFCFNFVKISSVGLSFSESNDKSFLQRFFFCKISLIDHHQWLILLLSMITIDCWYQFNFKNGQKVYKITGTIYVFRCRLLCVLYIENWIRTFGLFFCLWISY